MESKIKKFAIIDSTLREGEQFAGSRFTTAHKIQIAKLLDEFGVEYIELSSPASSPLSFEDCKILRDLGLRAKLTPHLRCDQKDIDLALATGVDSFNLLFATSQILQQYSHGKTIDFICQRATEIIKYLKEKGKEVRFSGEDAFRSKLKDLEKVFRAVIDAGVDRIGIPDTVGRATPFEVYEIISHFRKLFSDIDIEFHCHNDTGCAIANAWAALAAGGTHISVSVLGIGERNGITSLGGLIARLYAINKDLVKKYNLKKLKELDELVANIVGYPIPFNNCLTSPTAFHHRAGIHTNAMIKNPASYEIFDLADFGVGRTIDIAHRLIGKNALKEEARKLNLDLNNDELSVITNLVKTINDQEKLTPEFVRNLLFEAARKNGRNPQLAKN